MVLKYRLNWLNPIEWKIVCVFSYLLFLIIPANLVLADEPYLTPVQIIALENELSTLLADGDANAAWEITMQIVAPHYTSRELMVLYIESALQSGHLIEAEEFSRQAWSIFPEHTVFLFYLIKLAYEENSCKSALRLIEQSKSHIVSQQFVDYFALVSKNCSSEWQTSLQVQITIENGLFGQASPQNLVVIAQGSLIDNWCEIYATSCQNQELELSQPKSKRKTYFSNTDLIVQNRRLSHAYNLLRSAAIRVIVPQSGNQSISSVFLSTALQTGRFREFGWALEPYIYAENATNTYQDRTMETSSIGFKFHKKQKETALGQVDYIAEYTVQNPAGNKVTYLSFKSEYRFRFNKAFLMNGFIEEKQRLPDIQTDIFGTSQTINAGIGFTGEMSSGRIFTISYSIGNQSFTNLLPYLNKAHNIDHRNYGFTLDMPVNLYESANNGSSAQTIWIGYKVEDRSSLDPVQNFNESTYSIGFKQKF